MSDKTTYHRIVDYLKGLLSNRQQHELEKEIMRDAFEEEAFEGLSRLTAKELESDMADLTCRLEARTGPGRESKLPFYSRIAAAAILFIALGSLLVIVLRKPSPAPLAEKEKTENVAVPQAKVPAPADTPNHKKEGRQEVLTKKPAKQVLADNRVTEKKEKPEIIPEMALEETKAVAMPTRAEQLKTAETESKENASGAPESGAYLSRVADNQGEPDTLNELVMVGYGNQKKTDETSDAFIKPVPPGGSLNDFKKWVNDRLDNTAFPSDKGKYNIRVNLTVKADGTIGDIHLIDSIPAAISRELSRVILLSPSWQPALQDNTPIESQVAVRFLILVE
jgi:hypothetical protein